MILIGQYDSPFVRRVAIAAQLYGLAYEHRPWSVWADADALAAINPARRVPTLVLDNGEVLMDSAAILDALDDAVGPDRALAPRSGEPRRRCLQLAALAASVAEKAVSLLYETVLHEAPSQVWIDRCRAQIGEGLDALEARYAAIASRYGLGAAISHADIMTVCAIRFVSEAHAGLFDPGQRPALAALAAHCEALEPFQAVVQPLTLAMKA
jgi:glutathione S-transferase